MLKLLEKHFQSLFVGLVDPALIGPDGQIEALSPLLARLRLATGRPLQSAAQPKRAGHGIVKRLRDRMERLGDQPCVMQQLSSERSVVRTLLRVAVDGQAGAEVEFRLEGTGFLRHMVRNIVGTLLEVGQGRRAPGELLAVLAAHDRSAAGPTAPARGLTLVQVRYGIPRNPEELERQGS